MASLAFSRDAQELAGHVHEHAHIALSVVTESGGELRRHKFGCAGLTEGVLETGLELLRGGPLERQADADPTTERKQLFGAEALNQPPVPGQDDGQKDVAIEM